jgi:hypothetical protein
LFRIALIFAAIMAVSFVQRSMPAAYRPAVLPAMMVIVIAITYALRHYNYASFKFYMCGKHRTIRYATMALIWVGVLWIMARPLVRQFWAQKFEIDAFPLFLLCLLASIIVGRMARVHIRPLFGRTKPHVFQGFGDEYLDSFSGSDQM